MANINEFINTAKELADLAGKKAGEAVEVSKLKINNAKINGEIQKHMKNWVLFFLFINSAKAGKKTAN